MHGLKDDLMLAHEFPQAAKTVNEFASLREYDFTTKRSAWTGWWPAICFLSASAVMLLPSSLVNADELDAYFADHIWTGQGEMISDGVLLVQDGKITGVGTRQVVEVPAEANRHELGSVTLIPGLVIAETTLVESAASSNYALSPEVRAVDGFDPFEDYDNLLAAGITTIQVAPTANRLMPGQGGVVKLAGSNPANQVLVDSESVKVAVTREALSPPTIYEPPVGAVSVERPVEPTQPQLATSLAEAIVGLRALFAEADEIIAGKPADDRLLQALAALKNSKTTFRWTAENAAEIQAALELSKQFDLNWVLVDPLEVDGALAEVDWSSDRAGGVLLNAELRPGRITNPSVPVANVKEPTPVWQRAKQLVEQGAEDKLAFRAATDRDLEKILYLASVLGRGGLTTDQILKTITVNPAKLLGVQDRVGSLRPTTDADFVVLSGEPLATSTQVLATYVDGSRVYQASETDDALIVRGGTIYTANGILHNASVSVKDGSIRGVGSSVSVPRGAQVRDFGQAVIVPGYLDMATALGIGGSLGDSLPLDTKLGEFLARDDAQIALARQGGVTTALLSSTRLPSPVVAFKLGKSPRALKDPVALRFEITGNLTAAEESMRRTLSVGKSYADAWTKYDEEYSEYKKKLAEYETAKAKYDAAVKAAEAKKQEEEKKAISSDSKKDGDGSDGKSQASQSKSDTPKDDEAKDSEKPAEGDKNDEASGKESTDGDGNNADRKSAASGEKKPTDESKASPELVEPKKPDEPTKPKTTSTLEPYRDLFAKKIAALVEASEAKAVEVAVKLFRTEFKLQTAMVAGQAAVANAKLLSDNDVLVVVGPTLIDTVDGRLMNFAAELAVHQIPIAFQSNASTGMREMPTAVSYAVYEGLGVDDAIAGFTTNPANFLGLGSIGAIETGKDADLVILSGPPTDLASEVLAVMIDGQFVYEKESE